MWVDVRVEEILNMNNVSISETNHIPVICPMVVLTKPKRTLPVSLIAMYHRRYSSSFLPPLNAGSSQDSTTDVFVTFTTVTFLGLEGGSVCVCMRNAYCTLYHDNKLIHLYAQSLCHSY